MTGMVRESGDMVTIAYEQGMEHDALSVTMPDGEHFQGKVVMVGRTTGISSGFANLSAHSSTGAHASGSGYAFGVANTDTGNMQAILFGNRGHSMRCSFQYANTSGLTNAGGIGVCETSAGKVIDVQW
jgi:hypothetical protein